MRGMDARTGKAIAGLDHLRQSIRMIVLTPKGTRVMLRTFGSRLLQLTDRPMDSAGQLDLIAATAEAVMTWESRLAPTEVTMTVGGDGASTVSLTGDYLPDGQPVTVDGIAIADLPAGPWQTKGLPDFLAQAAAAGIKPETLGVRV